MSRENGFGRLRCDPGHLPLLLVAIIVITFVITYSVAVQLNHVYPFWPYISDTGTYPPESSIFALLLNVACVVLLAIIYVRHRQVSELSKVKPYAAVSRRWNLAATITGCTATLGLQIVATFQETNLFLVHISGAFLCFIFSAVYFVFQCVFTYKMKFASRTIFWWRVAFTCVNVLAFISVFAPLKAAADRFKGKNILMWGPKDGGYGFHLISTISEWILVLTLCLYICTFYWEFRRFGMTLSRISFTDLAIPENGMASPEREEVAPRTSQWI